MAASVPRVVVCDDAAGYRVMMSAVLQDARLEVVGLARSWDDAIELVKTERTDGEIVNWSFVRKSDIASFPQIPKQRDRPKKKRNAAGICPGFA